MLHLAVSAWLTRTRRVSRRCDKTRSLSRTCSRRRPSLSSFVYTFVEGRWSACSGSFSFPLSLARPLSLSRSHRRLRRFRLRRATPSGGAGLFSLLRSLRKLLRLPPTIAVRRVSNEFGGARIVRQRILVALGPREKRDGAPRLAPSNAHPCRPLPTLYVHQRRFRRELTRSGSSSSHRRFSRCYRLPRDSFRSADEAVVTRGKTLRLDIFLIENQVFSVPSCFFKCLVM